jgi:hypothetical protein
MIIIKSGNSLEVRKQNKCTYKDILYTIMRNVKVMMISPSTECLTTAERQITGNHWRKKTN